MARFNGKKKKKDNKKKLLFKPKMTKLG